MTRPDRFTPAARLPSTRTLARGPDFRVSEYVCTAGPGDRPFEEQHDWAVLSVVQEGTFSYRTDSGRTLLYPGSVLLGNPGACYECGHEHGTGDRCLAVHVPADTLEEIGSAIAGTRKFRFPVGMMPLRRDLLSTLVDSTAIAYTADGLARETQALAFVERVVRHVSGGAPAPVRMSARDARRIGRVLREIGEAPGERWELGRLAALAAMSKFHFLRTFKRVAGITPHELVVALRLRDAALRLRNSDEKVARVAYDAGFGDLATFNAGFRRAFGTPPRAYRTAHRGI